MCSFDLISAFNALIKHIHTSDRLKTFIEIKVTRLQGVLRLAPVGTGIIISCSSQVILQKCSRIPVGQAQIS